MAEFLAVIYILYLVGMGQAWYRFLVRPAVWRWPQLAWSFGLGTILWSYASLFLNLLNIPTNGGLLYVWQMLLIVIPVGGGMLFKWPTQIASSAPRTIPVSWMKPVAFFICGVAALTALFQALAYPMHLWDSIVIYGFKAKILFQEQTFKTDAFMDPSVLHYSADYPLLLPYVEAGFYRWLGHVDDRVVRLLFLVYWGSWLGILYEALVERLRKDYAWILLCVIATLPLFSNIYMGQAVSGFADIPLAFYWSAFLLCGFQVRRDGFNAAWVMMALFAFGCAFTKNEGFVAMVLGWVIFIAADHAPHRRFWIRPVSAGILLILPWWWLRSVLPHNSAHYARVLALRPAEILSRLRIIGTYLASEWMQIRSWGIFWPLIFLGLLWPQRRLRFPKESKMLLAAVSAQLGVYGYVYLTYPQNLEVLVPVTLLRLLLHTIGPLTLAVGWRLEE